MYVYIRSEPGLFTVGHYSPDGKWHAESDYADRDEAAARVHWLNGGQASEGGGGSWDEYRYRTT